MGRYKKDMKEHSKTDISIKINSFMSRKLQKFPELRLHKKTLL